MDGTLADLHPAQRAEPDARSDRSSRKRPAYSAIREATAAFDKDGALTYLTRRLSAERTPEGGKLWEFGVVGHGVGSSELVAQVLDSIRTWDREHRSHQVRFEIHPVAELPEPSPGRFFFSTPFNQIIIDWADGPKSASPR